MGGREETIDAIRDLLVATIDPDDGLMVVAQQEYAAIHKGLLFNGGVYDLDLDTDGVLSIGFRTPVAVNDAHIEVFAYVHCTDAATYEILEAATVTAGTGVALTLFNRDRRSVLTPTVLDTSTAPATIGRATKNPTITDDGTAILTELLGVGKQKQEGETRSLMARILKYDTQYVYRVKARVDNVQVHLLVDLFEHVS